MDPHPTPHYMHEYENKGFKKWVRLNWLILKAMFFVH
jgi:hypothetical protein